MDNSEPIFRDETQILVTAGNGGDGCISFYREKFVTHGGPDGGDGGAGGSIVLRADEHENSLFRLARMSQIAAQHGAPGGSKNCFGKAGEDTVVIVPVGTQIFDASHGNLLADMTLPGQEIVVAAGGRGGRGNARFASSTQQTPVRAEEGHTGETRRLRLELKLMADVGLVGLPNAGKSTLLRKLTAARPRVGAYPFTTLHPSLGVMLARGHGASLVLADIPGLIEGAAEGRGLGLRFLRHVERTRLLVHLVDCSSGAEDPAAAYQVVRQEIGNYAPELARRPVLVAATKVEDEESGQRAAALAAALAAGDEPVEVLPISAATGAGIPALTDRLFALAAGPAAARPEEGAVRTRPKA